MQAFDQGQKAADQWQDDPGRDIPETPTDEDFTALEQAVGREPTQYERRAFIRGFKMRRNEIMQADQ